MNKLTKRTLIIFTIAVLMLILTSCRSTTLTYPGCNPFGLIVFFIGIGVSRLINPDKKSVNKMDRTAAATLIDMQETRLYRGSGRKPGIEMVYKFYTDTGLQVRAKELLFFSVLDAQRFKIGMQLQIRYQSDNPSNAVYDRNAGGDNTHNWQQY